MPEVRLACVVGVPHPKWDERPIAVVELEEGKTKLTLRDVRKHCAEHFAKFQLPDDLVIWPKVPVSGTGKIDKKEVRAKLAKLKYVLPALRQQARSKL
mmetsp:Transcript_7253/g.14233  ORF Transcript_7253/g.14233 Transcript_7253/m.14233 type:complete len:98 (+) Transcript_7253:124-417(+)